MLVSSVLVEDPALDHSAVVGTFCDENLKVYEASPRRIEEDYGHEVQITSGGYAYRQLFELVQNGADAILEAGDSTGRIHVLLTDSKLIVANTGAPLSRDGIGVLINAGASSKRGDQIGRFGLGFKSLLKLGGTVEIASRSVGLRFDPDWCRARIRERFGLPDGAHAPGMRLAMAVEPDGIGDPAIADTLSWATTVVWAQVGDRRDHARLAQEIEDFPAEFVLFLTHDLTLTLDVQGKVRREISKRLEGGISSVRDGADASPWRVFQTRVSVDDEEARKDAADIQARSSVPMIWAYPVSTREQAGKFWAFFPTETATRCAGILNAPWKLNSDRTNLIRGPWNAFLMRAGAAFIAENLAALATDEDPGAPLDALPRRLDERGELAATLVDALWSRVADAPIVAGADGNLRAPADLGRHPSSVGERWIRDWAALAPEQVRAGFVHPSCHRTANRASRLKALAEEASERSDGEGARLPEIAISPWLERIAAVNLAGASAVLRFAGALAREPGHQAARAVKAARIIPTMARTLAAAARVVMAPSNLVPEGVESVAVDLLEQDDVRALLRDVFGVREEADEAWRGALEAHLSADGRSKPVDWDVFWRDAAAAPEAVARDLLARHASDLAFRTRAGGWIARCNLVCIDPEEGSDISPVLNLDRDFHAQHEARLPTGSFSQMPASRETWIFPEYERGEPLSAYFAAIKARGWPKMPAGPQRRLLDVVDSPVTVSEWRLLAALPRRWRCGLTARLAQRVVEKESFRKPVQYGHTTRREAYPTFSAPHPNFLLLSEFGQIAVDGFVVPLRWITGDDASLLAAVGFDDLRVVAECLARRLPTDLGDALPEAGFGRTEAEAHRMWDLVFSALSRRTGDLGALAPVWDRAGAVGAVPKLVPTRDGPRAVSDIYVAPRGAEAASASEDGRTLRLSAPVADAWLKRGAKSLDDSRGIAFAAVLSEPVSIRDMVPELTADMVPRPPRAAWVEGLIEIEAEQRRSSLAALYRGGLVLLDRAQYEALPAEHRFDGLIAFLHRIGALNVDPATALARLKHDRTAAARLHVSGAADLVERLLRAVGRDRTALLGTLNEATRRTLDAAASDEVVAGLVLAVHGPTVLSVLRLRLGTEGLDPPKRWGNEAAHAFARDLGFPPEYGASAARGRDPEIVVSGPLRLPDLHDFQRAIFDDVRELIASGRGRRRAVISLPTGGGKTRVAAQCVVELVLNVAGSQRVALWVAQTDELCEQAVQCFRQVWVNKGAPGQDLRIVRLWGGQKSPAPPEDGSAVVVVASIQTLNARPEAKELGWLRQPRIVVIDECHHAITPSYTSLLRWIDVQTGSQAARAEEAAVLGLSATPWRGYDEDESERLAARFDRRWFPGTAAQEALHDLLRDRKVLARARYSTIDPVKPFDLTPTEMNEIERFKEFPDSAADRLSRDPERNALIVERVLANRDRSTLLFANSVAHAQVLAAKLHLAGCAAAAVSGDTDRLARQHFIRAFGAGSLKVLCNHSVLATGFDAPRTDMILISRPVFSSVRYMQMVGRGLRGTANGGTEVCDIVTVRDNIVNYSDRLAFHYCQRFFSSSR